MEQELEAHTDIWGRNSKEALVALDAACFIFFSVQHLLLQEEKGLIKGRK